MNGSLVLATWMAIGVIIAGSRRDGREPAPAWIVAGALLGPFWLIITHDQVAVDAAAPPAATGESPDVHPDRSSVAA